MSIIKIYSDGAGSVLGKRVALYYFLTTVIACVTGIISANIFAPLFLISDDSEDDDGAEVILSCPKDYGDLTMLDDGSLMCLSETGLPALNLSDRY